METCLSYRDARNRATRFQIETGRGVAKQEFKDECDINKIMAQYLSQGSMPATAKVGTYGDFAAVPEYRQSLDILNAAAEQFAGLPSKVRDRFKNDPVQFLDFVHDAKNLEECHDLGLLTDEGAKKVTAGREAKAKAKADAERERIIAEHEKSKPVK